MTNPTLAPYAKEGECELRITAKAADEESARALIAPVEERLRARGSAPSSTAPTYPPWRRRCSSF